MKEADVALGLNEVGCELALLASLLAALIERIEGHSEQVDRVRAAMVSADVARIAFEYLGMIAEHVQRIAA